MNDEPTADKSPPRALSLAELRNTPLPEQQWAIEGVFENGTVNMISAKPNQFKTWISLHMATCLAAGTAVFGRFETAQQPVMIWNAEDGIRMMKSRMALLAPPEDDLPIYFHVGHDMTLSNDTVSALLEEMRSLDVRFLVIDPLCDVHGGDENSAQDMGTVFRHLRRFAHEGITVLIVHHWRKGSGQYDKNDQLADEARGSSVIQGALNGHLSCRPAVKQTDGSMIVSIVQTKLKDAEKLAPFDVRFTIEDGRAYLDFLGETEPRGGDDAGSRILAFLSDSNGWVTTSTLLSQSFAGTRKVRDALAALTNAGRIQKNTRKGIQERGEAVHPLDGAHNEQCYRLEPVEEPTS